MTRPCTHLSRLSPEQTARYEAITDRFDACWALGDPPAFEQIIGEPLPGEEPLRSALVIDLAAADLEHRVKRNHPIDVGKHYLDPYPDIKPCQPCLLELYK